MTFKFEITPALQVALPALLQAKASHITLIVKDHKLSLGVATPEFFQILTSQLAVNCEDIALRISKKGFAPFIYMDVISIDVGNVLTITGFKSDVKLIVISLPLELDLHTDFFDEAFASIKDASASCDLRQVLSLKPLVDISSSGLQVADGRAFIISDGCEVYQPFPIALNCMFTKEFMSMLLPFIKTNTFCRISKCGNYIVFIGQTSMLGWLMPRTLVQDEYDCYKQQIPLYEVKASLGNVKSVIAALPAAKNTPVQCSISLATGMMRIQYGTDLDAYISLFPPDEKQTDTIYINYTTLRGALACSILNFSKVDLVVYKRLIALKIDTTEILLVRL